MLNGDKLAIFDFFKIDQNLPKWKKPEKNSDNKTQFDDNDSIPVNWNNGVSGISFNSNDVIVEFRKRSLDYLQYLKREMDKYDVSLFTKVKYYVFIYFTSLFVKGKTKEVLEKYTYTIEDFFKTIKDSKMEISTTLDILKKYETVLIEARKNGQQSLVEKLLKMKDVISSECRLIENGITKYVTEEQVVKLYKNVDKKKNLKLTYLENYIRVIPSDVIKLKDSTDQIKIFDNYVILHFDPFNNSTDLTEKEKVDAARSKDPIMFGVIQNSRKLYFIGDWIDEYCDLTLDKMVETIGEKEFNLSNESVISYINTI